MTEKLKRNMLENITIGFDNRYHRFYKGNDQIPNDATYIVDKIIKDNVKPVGEKQLWVEIYFHVIDDDGKCYICENSNTFIQCRSCFLLEAKWGETIIIKDDPDFLNVTPFNKNNV